MDTTQVEIRLFAGARERAGQERVALRVPVNATIGDVRTCLVGDVPELAPWAAHLLFAIGTEYVTDADALPAHGEIVAFPPVSGG